MITLKEISLAITNKLEEVLPEFPIESNDIKEGFPRPSLFFEFENVKTADYIGGKRERTVSVIIYFFPTDIYKHEIEMLEVQEALEEAFSGQFMIEEGFFVYPLEVNSVKSDGVLQFSFDIYTLEYKDTSNEPMMEELEVKIRKD
ncbi:phage tail terminator family protein [Marinicrinis sediminis]|uniref:DUF6838 family protein n=1 Tax=Marinicrinis sediminis TaxID=1652465 RepID=A0ABW5R9U5_9BACL